VVGLHPCEQGSKRLRGLFGVGLRELMVNQNWRRYAEKVKNVWVRWTDGLRIRWPTTMRPFHRWLAVAAIALAVVALWVVEDMHGYNTMRNELSRDEAFSRAARAFPVMFVLLLWLTRPRK
jgi:hypothetical protein